MPCVRRFCDTARGEQYTCPIDCIVVSPPSPIRSPPPRPLGFRSPRPPPCSTHSPDPSPLPPHQLAPPYPPNRARAAPPPVFNRRSALAASDEPGDGARLGVQREEERRRVVLEDPLLQPVCGDDV